MAAVESVEKLVKRSFDGVLTPSPSSASDPHGNGFSDAANGHATHRPLLDHGSRVSLKPAQDINVTFSNVCMSVQAKKNGEMYTKHILKNINGSMRPGQLIAIMGASGSGKTSLLNTLAGRIPPNCDIGGSMDVNGRPVGKDFKNVSAYVMQDDVLFAQQTVYETLLTAALLRLPRTQSRQQKEKVVENIISQLGLTNCRNTKIGDALTRGVSGGERKRVSIGIELVRDVSAMFLDEPTTGLDSAMAYSVMQHLSVLAKNTNRLVVASIHQPRSNIFELFDKILLLSDGRMMYFGDAKQAIPYFDRIGYKCPPGFNYADYLLDITVPRFTADEQQTKSLARVQRLAEEWVSHSRMYSDDHHASEPTWAKNKPSNNYGPQFKEEGRGASWPYAFWLLFLRGFQEVSRNKFATVAMVVQSVIFSLIIGGIFFNLGSDQNEQQDRAGILFFAVMNMTMGNMFPVLHKFSFEKAIFMREHQSGFYGTSAYFLAKVASLLPAVPFVTGVFIAVLYPMASLRQSWGHGFIMYGILVVSALSSQGLGLMMGAMAPNFETAQIFAPLMMIVFMLTSGFFINLDNISPAFRWLQYISFMRYALSAVNINEFKGVTFTCVGNELDDGTCALPDGQTFLDQLGVGDETIIFNVGLLLVLIFAFFLIGYLSLRAKTPNPRFLTDEKTKKWSSDGSNSV